VASLRRSRGQLNLEVLEKDKDTKEERGCNEKLRALDESFQPAINAPRLGLIGRELCFPN